MAEQFKGLDQFVKPEPKPVPAPAPVRDAVPKATVPAQREAVVIRSELDTYIHERLKSQPQSLHDIKVEDTDPSDEAKRILSLPKQLERYGTKYAFRWINKRKRSIDYAIDVVGWKLVNRALFPELPDYLMTANGTIERGDCILAVIPIQKAMELRIRPSQLSRERVNALPVQDLRKWKDTGSEHHYKPDLGAAERDDEPSRGITVTPDADIVETQE